MAEYIRYYERIGYSHDRGDSISLHKSKKRSTERFSVLRFG